MMKSLLTLTGDEAAFFAKLPSTEREAVVARLAAVAAVTNAKHGKRDGVAARHAQELGVSLFALSRWVASFRRDGWRGLIDFRVVRSPLTSN